MKAIDGVSSGVCKGETYCLVGETGCEKSVTARALTRLIRPPEDRGGEIYYYRDGEKIDIMSLS